MYKVGKVFMEDAYIELNDCGERIVICPICEEEILLADNELAGDTILCELCNTPLKLLINMLELDEKLYDLIKWVVDTYGISKKEAIASIINKVEKL